MILVTACAGPAVDDTAHPEDTAAQVTTADDLLARLRADRDATLLEVANTEGWPVAVEDGRLFVAIGKRETHLAGEFDGWAGQPMTEEDDFRWLVADVQGAYKFTDGTEWTADRWSRAYTFDEYGEMSLAAPSEAHLERLFEVGGRVVRAWIPSAPTHTLYVHDGQNLFDPAAMRGGWKLHESAPEGMLVVGIDNTAERIDEYTHVTDTIDGVVYGGGGDAYATFIAEEVRPLVRTTWGEAGPVGTMGSSLGGLIAFHLADRQPGEWAFAGSLSGTMGWGSIGAHNETMIERYAAAGHRDTALYLDSGGSGTCHDSDGDGILDDDADARDNYCENIQFRDTLAEAGYTFDADLWHWHEPGATHDEAAWAARVWRPLEIFAGL